MKTLIVIYVVTVLIGFVWHYIDTKTQGGTVRDFLDEGLMILIFLPFFNTVLLLTATGVAIFDYLGKRFDIKGVLNKFLDKRL